MCQPAWKRRTARPALLLFTFFLVPSGLNAQQVSSPTPRDPQSITLLQRSLAVLVGTNTIKDVTLNGNATWIAGSDNETGTAILRATSIGQGRIDLSLSDGQRSDVADISQTVPIGSWCGPDGTWHAMAGHNLLSDPSWFFPTFLISRALSTVSYAITTADAETKDGIAVQHIAVYRQASQGDPNATLTQNLSRTDIYLNSSTLAPVAIDFNIHPDNDALTNIPMEIEFSNYQNTQGALVPYHIQRYVQNGLTLDVTVTSVQLNTGIAATDFQAQ